MCSYEVAGGACVMSFFFFFCFLSGEVQCMTLVCVHDISVLEVQES